MELVDRVEVFCGEMLGVDTSARECGEDRSAQVRTAVVTPEQLAGVRRLPPTAD